MNSFKFYFPIAFVLAGMLSMASSTAAETTVVQVPPSKLNAPLGNAGPEPALQAILDRLGYAIDVTKDEIEAPLFVRVGRRDVVHRPISAFGLMERLKSGWYGLAPDTLPKKQSLWAIESAHNKQDAPPIEKEGKTRIPSKEPFGLWVSTAGFKNETVYSEDSLQIAIPRFPLEDKHKVRVFPAKTKKGVQKNAYILCWEYSTNNDFQDVVTRIENVTPFIIRSVYKVNSIKHKKSP